MTRELMTTREVAEYLRIKERKVYDLVRQRRIPCSRVTGKWLFPKPLVDLWVTEGVEYQPRDSEADFAYFGELAADVTMHASDWVQFSFGYTALFLNEVATAPGNFDFSTATPEGEKFVRSGANLLYRGGTGMARVTFKLP